jgi:hypothetical protein
MMLLLEVEVWRYPRLWGITLRVGSHADVPADHYVSCSDWKMLTVLMTGVYTFIETLGEYYSLELNKKQLITK